MSDKNKKLETPEKSAQDLKNSVSGETQIPETKEKREGSVTGSPGTNEKKNQSSVEKNASAPTSEDLGNTSLGAAGTTTEGSMIKDVEGLKNEPDNSTLTDSNKKNTQPAQEDPGPGNVGETKETTSFEFHSKILHDGGKIRKVEWADKSAYLKISREEKVMMYHDDTLIGQYNDFNQSDRDSEWEEVK